MLFPADGTSGAGAPTGGGNAPTVGGGDGGGTQPAGGTAPARNWEKDYSDLEARYREVEPWGKARERHGFKTEVDLDNAVAWARRGIELQSRFDRGEYVSKAEVERHNAQQPAAAPATPTDPFESWDELEPRQRSAATRDYIGNEIKRAIQEAINPLAQRVDSSQQQNLSQIQLVMEIAREVAKNPDLPIDDALVDAVQSATITPVDRLKLAIQNRLAPKKQEKAIEDAVKQAIEAERAKVKQDADNAQIHQFSQRSAPRLVKRAPNTRGDAMRETFQNFLKKADQLQRDSG